MEWSEVDLDEARIWTIPRGKAKSDRSHEVQLSESVIALLRSLPRLGPYVFTGKSGRGVTGFTYGKDLLDSAMTEVSAAPRSRLSSYTTFDGAWRATWRSSALRRMWSIAFSTILAAAFAALPPSTIASNISESAGPRWPPGRRMSLG